MLSFSHLGSLKVFPLDGEAERGMLSLISHQKLFQKHSRFML